MPGGDGTGPMGAGPRTGRAMGYCNSFAAPVPMGGRGFGCGMGFGRGRRWGSGRRPFGPAAMSNQASGQELDALKQQAQALQDSLNRINDRIEQLQK